MARMSVVEKNPLNLELVGDVLLLAGFDVVEKISLRALPDLITGYLAGEAE